MPVIVTVTGTEKLRRLAAAIKASGNKDLDKELTSAMRRLQGPLKASARQGALQILPYRGGLAERVAAGRFTATVRKSGRTAGLRITASDRRDADVNRMDDGTVRHPVFGHWRKGMPPQKITPGWFSNPLKLDAPKVAREVDEALDAVAAKLEASV